MKKIIFIVFMTAIFAACKKPDQLGPDIKGIFGPLNITQSFAASTSNVNFSTGATVYFTAKFENDAIWTVTIVGATSTAVKTITGVSKELNSFNCTWDGTADVAPSFRNENVTATISFSNSSNTYSVPITISGTKSLDAGGVLVTNFNSVPPGTLVQFYSGNETYTTNNWISDYPVTVFNNTLFPQPDGGPYLFMGDKQPTNANKNSPGNVDPYVDFLQMWPASSGFGNYYPLYGDPTKVYFNVMVANTGTQYTWLRVFLEEEGIAARYIDIKPDWTGWKLLSFNYTDFVSDDQGNKASFNPQKITSINFILLSDAPQNILNLKDTADKISVAFDHVIFTHNQPYQP